MEKLVPTKEEVEDAIARMSAWNPGVDYVAKIEEAIKEGYKNEKCPKCEVTFIACIHFIKCAADVCPMKDQKDKRSLLDQMFDVKDGKVSQTPKS